MKCLERNLGLVGNNSEFLKDTYTKDISKNLKALMDSWNPEVKDLPPEKVIRDFNSFILSGRFRPNTIRTLAGFVSDLSEENLLTNYMN